MFDALSTKLPDAAVIGRRLVAGLFASLAVAGLSVGAAEAQSRDGHDRRILLRNMSSEPIVAFHASNVGTGDWEENILAGSVVRPGRSVILNLDDGTGYCRFDFRTTMASGQNLYRWSIDVCTLETYTIY